MKRQGPVHLKSPCKLAILTSIHRIMHVILDITTTLYYAKSNLVGKGLMVKIKNRLKVARAEKNISQGSLAEMVGVTRQTVSAVETGQYCPSTKLALILAAKLEKRVEDLFYLAEE